MRILGIWISDFLYIMGSCSTAAMGIWIVGLCSCGEGCCDAVVIFQPAGTKIVLFYLCV
jgi:hypothetical protein